MADPTTDSTVQPYINNPFFVAIEGIKLFFTKALGIAILLVILSALGSINFSGFDSPSSQQAPASNTSQGGAIDPSLVIGIVVLVLLIATAIFVIGTIINGISAYGSAKVSRNETAGLKEAWKATLKHFGGFLWLQILIGFKVFAWSLLFFVPGIIMFYRYSLANIAFFDKGLRGNAAIDESLALTKGSWLLTFSSQVLLSVISLGALSKLVSASATAILYHQFQTTPVEQRPKAHGLAIATLVFAILTLLVGIAAIIALGFMFANYAQSPAE